MRPTIPLAGFRLAVDRTLSDALAHADRGNAIGCTCAWCANWQVAHLGVLPAALLEQLQRVGVDVRRPSELYAFDVAPGGHHLRLQFFLSGQVLSGPTTEVSQPYSHGDRSVTARAYETVAPAPRWIDLAVVPSAEAPSWVPAGIGSILEIDFRLYVPWRLSSAPPSLTEGVNALVEKAQPAASEPGLLLTMRPGYREQEKDRAVALQQNPVPLGDTQLSVIDSMRHADLRAVGHNIADSVASGIGLMIGVYGMDIFKEARSQAPGFIEVDFLEGTSSGVPASESLQVAIALYTRAALPDLCAKHSVDLSEVRSLRARFGVDSALGRTYVVTVEDARGKRSEAQYLAWPGRRLRRGRHKPTQWHFLHA